MADSQVPAMPNTGNSVLRASEGGETLNPNITERDFTTKFVNRAKSCGWLVYHPLPARTKGGGWTVALQGHRGWPDLCIAQDGVVLLIELKSSRGRLTDAQKDWLEASGGAVFRPRDWPRICEILDLPELARQERFHD